MKAFFKNAALCLVSCLVALGGIEIALRLWGPDVLAMGNQYVFYQFDPVLGWANLPNMHGQFSRIEFSYPVDINSLGMRDAEIVDRRPDEFRVAVVGDSFTWGVGAAYGERFTEVVEQRSPKINVLNFGVSGYSPVQYLLQLDKVVALKPDYVVLAFCLGNDLAENVSYTPYDHPKPYVRLTPDGQGFEIKGYPLANVSQYGPYLVGAASASRIIGMIKVIYDLKHKPQGGGFNVDDELAYLPADKLAPDKRELAKEMFKLNDLLLAAIKQKVDAALGPHRLAVLVVPTKYEMGAGLLPGSDRNLVANAVLATLSRLGVPAIDGRPVLTISDFWKVDGHWRPSGQRKIGELLAQFLAEAKDDGGHPFVR